MADRKNTTPDKQRLARLKKAVRKAKASLREAEKKLAAEENKSDKPISTDLQLGNLKTIGSIYDRKVANEPGLVVRVGKSGTKSFRWDRGGNHKPRIITHGTYPSLSLADARKAHQKARRQHAAGTLALDAALDSQKRKDAKTKDDVTSETTTLRTVADLAEMFYSDYASKKQKRPEIARRVLDADILPVIGEMKLNAVNPLTVRAVIKLVVDRGAPVYAKRVLGILKQIFALGVSYQVIDNNPVTDLNPDMLGIESNERNRTLSSSEVKQLWELPYSDSVGTALKLLLLLGIRSGELRQAQWVHVDFDAGLLTVPVDNQKLKLKEAKKAKPFVVPLDDYAISLLQQQKKLNDSVWIFPGREGKPMGVTTLPQSVRIMGEIDFTPHDLRRTMRSGLSKLGIKPHVAERCLNHSLGKIQDIYDQYDYLDERRSALEKWSQHVQVVIGQHENVVELRA